MSNPQPDQPSLADRLRDVRVGLRQDLEVSRHVFRGEPSYIVRDPITFGSHRFGPADYSLLVSIDTSRTLGEIYTELAERSGLGPEDEEPFYQFVFSLHGFGFLNLPISDDKRLYQRYEAKKRAKTKQRLMGFLFLQIPLVNPDAFLTRTLPYARWLFTRTFFMIWLLLVGAAFYIGATNWQDLVQPVHGLLATRNLVVMWFTLIGLKILHEFGHAYACKSFGGHVPEMGAYLIAFTPCAYVDATASWGFTSKRERLIVSLAGVYVEMIFASLAVFVWALTSESLLNSIAYNVIFLAGAVTLLFNINPLMRYDGYYVASDWLEIPNLRARSTQHVQGIAKRLLLGIRAAKAPVQRRMRVILTGFGLSATMYKSLVLVGIATMIAFKFSTAGLFLAAMFLGSAVVGMVRRLAGYLWFAQETAPMRYRAVALSVVIFAVLPALAALIPLPTSVQAAGEVAAEREAVARATAPGFIEEVTFQRGQDTRAGDVLVRLSDSSLTERVAEACAAMDASRIRRRAYEFSDPAAARQEAEQMLACTSTLSHHLRQLAELRIVAPAAGRIADGIQTSEVGRFVEAGEELAALISGQWVVRAVITAEQYAAAGPAAGDHVTFRAAGDADVTLAGTITTVSPVGSRRVDLQALTTAAGGDVVVEPATGETTQPYFELRIALNVTPDIQLRQGLTGVIQLQARPEPLLMRAYRGVTRFINKIRKS